MERLVRRGSLSTALLAAFGALIFAFQALPEVPALWFSDLVYPTVAIGAGVLLALGALYRRGKSQLAWTLFGIGVVLLGLGELAWSWYELVLEMEPPFPGWPDVFYLAGYPALVAGVLLTPRLAANPYQRGQQLIDAIVIIAGLAVMAWMTVLDPMYQSSAGTPLAELLVGAAYPIGDVFLLAAIGVAGLRRAVHLRDYSSWCLIAGLVVMAVGDFLYLVELPIGSYSSGTWLDATWLLSYGLFALSAYWLPDEMEPRLPREGRLPIWYVLVPVLVVLVINGIHLWDEVSKGESIVIEGILSFLAFLILGRLLMVVGEDRHLVEEERDRLISVVSHELRTPLTAVEGYTGLALTDWDSLGDQERREMIEIAQGQARLVTRIVTDLVETSRDSLHSIKLHLETVDVGELVKDVVRYFEASAKFELSLEPGCTVEADRDRLAQIVTNLVSNAERYGGDGPIVGQIGRIEGGVEIAIHDSGPGVPHQFQQRIWGAFERGAHRFDASTPGSGLGLAIVRSLAEAHGGTVGYRKSDLLDGACFWVCLPPPEFAPQAPSGAHLGKTVSQSPVTAG